MGKIDKRDALDIQGLYRSFGWNLIPAAREHTFVTTYVTGKHKWDYVVVVAGHATLAMFARLPLRPRQDQRAEVGRFIEQINFGMIQGAWVLDRQDGEVRFRVSVAYQGIELSTEYVKDLTLYTNFTMETFLPGFKTIIEDGCTAEEAYERVYDD